MILVTGASGFLGRHLLARLQALGYPVRGMVRTARACADLRARGYDAIVAEGLEAASFRAATRGIDTVCHLIQHLSPSEGCEEHERRLASNLLAACRVNGIRRIITVNRLGATADTRHPHLAARFLGERLLRESDRAVTVIRAGLILGESSPLLHFFRQVAALPVTVIPSWGATRVEPIHVNDLVAYIIAAIEHPDSFQQTFDVGCEDVTTYRDILESTATTTPIVSLPPFLDGLSNALLTWISDLPGIADHLSLLYEEQVCRERTIRAVFPHTPIRLREFFDSVSSTANSDELAAT